MDVSTESYVSQWNTTANDTNNELDEVKPGRILIAIFACTIILGTIGGNSIVIFAVATSRRLRKVGNIFIVNLAMADILVGTVVTPLALVYSLTGTWPFGRQICDFWISMDIICCTASIVSLGVISYDRFNAITRPLKYAKKRTYKRASIAIVFIWMYSICIALPPLFGWGEQDSESVTCEITREKGYTIFSTCGAFYLPLILIIFSYSKIFCVTIKSRKDWTSGPGTSKRIRSDRSDTKTDTELCCKPELKQTVCCKQAKSKEEFTGENVVSHAFQTTSKLILVTPCIDVEKNLMMKNMFISLAEETKKKETDLQRAVCNRKVLLRQSSNFNSDSSGSTSTMNSSDSVNTVESDISIQKLTPPTPLKNALRCEQILEEPRKSILSVPSPERRHRNSVDERSVSFPPSPTNQSKREHTRKPSKRIHISQERRAARTLGIVMGCFIICWLPFFLVAIIRPLCSACNMHPMILDFVLWLGYCNSALNPIIYTFFNTDFRKAFRQILCCFKNIPAAIHL